MQWLAGLAAIGLVTIGAGCGGGGGAAAVTTVQTVTLSATTAVRSAESKPLSFPQLVAHVQSGVLRIEASGCTGSDVGTGFLIAPNLIATVEHVVDGSSRIVIKRRGVTLASARVIGADSSRDLALLRTSTSISGHVFRLATRAPALGEAVAAFGFPLGLPLTVTRGSVSGLDRAIPIGGITRHRLVQTDAAVNPGNSGGPLLAADSGDVVGLVDLGTAEANGLAFAVSAQVAGPLLHAWKVAPQPTATGGCGSGGPAASAAPSPAPSTDKSSIADTIYGYWDAIQAGDYTTAFSYLTPAEGAAIGGEATFVSQHAADPLQSVDVLVAVTSLSASSATADVVRLRTIAPSTGCRDWSGSYELAKQSGIWLIDRATLNFTNC